MLLVTGVLLITIGLFVWFRSPTVRTYKLVVAAGERAKTRYQLAVYLARYGSHFGLELVPVDSTGSLDIMRQVQAGKIDIGFVQGGIRLSADTNVRQVAYLNVEPLQLLVRPELVDACRKDLSRLAGKRVNISTRGSGTHLLALEVLKFAELVPEDRSQQPRFIEQDMSVVELERQLDRIAKVDPASRAALIRKLPDAVFLVSTLPSDFIRTLVETANYRLVPLPFADAFSTVSLKHKLTSHCRIDHMMVLQTEIPPYTYSVSPAVPDKPCETIGAHLVVIANKNVPIRAVERLLQMIYGGTLHHIYKPPPLESLAPQYRWHAGTVAYRDRNRPLVRVEIIEALRRVTTIFASILTGLLALYGFYRWRQVLRFKAYFARIDNIEARARELAHSQREMETTQQELHELLDQLDSTRQEAVDDFANGYFRGEAVVVALLSYVNSAQQSLHQIMTDLADRT